MNTTRPGTLPDQFFVIGLLCLTAGLTAATVPAQEVYLPSDIGWETAIKIRPYEPKSLAALGSTLLFAAPDGTFVPDSDHLAVWRSDGTVAGTELVVDLYTLEDLQGMTVRPDYLKEWNGSVFFTAADDTRGVELWRTDGTLAGTSMVKDINPGSGSSRPLQLTVSGGSLYFRADDGVHGTELWKTDGTEAGTLMVRDIYPGSTTSYPWDLVDVGGTLFFTARNSGTNEELWKSDGTEAGTVLVKDIRPGSTSSYPDELTNIDGTLYLEANGGNGYELWKSNGTAAGTVEVKDIYSGTDSSSPSGLTALGSLVVFGARTSAEGVEIWVSDGTAAGTRLLLDIYPSTSSSYPSYLSEYDGAVYFSANDGTNGKELWKTDGTTLGTVLVKDIRSGSGTSDPRRFAEYDGLLYFAAAESSTQDNLWRTDGSSTGTERVAVTSCSGPLDYPTDLTVAGPDMYFRCGSYLWITDGTEIGTTILRTIVTLTADAMTYETAALGHSVFFDARRDGTSWPAAAYRTDGTEFGTHPTGPWPSSEFAPSSRLFQSTLGAVYYSAADASNFPEPWIGDEHGQSTMLKDINPLFGSESAGYAQVGGSVFFAADDGINGSELWITDGSEAGTRLVEDVWPGPDHSYPQYITDLGGIAVFTALDPAGQELWRSDGTEAGTEMILDINPFGHSFPSSLTPIGSRVFFTADNGFDGREPWVTDGNTTGTSAILDINPGPESAMLEWSTSGRTGFTALGGIAYFAADDGVHGVELWRSDGTPGGTWMVVDLHPMGSSNPSWIVEWNGLLYFASDDGLTGNELWRSDGTAPGTSLVADIWPGGISSSPREITVARGRLNFAASNGVNGIELWKSNGTAPGTVLVEDLLPGVHSSAPTHLTASDGPLYFVADDDVVGRELWAACEPRPNPVLTAPPSVCQYSVGNSASVTDPGPGSQFVWDVYDGTLIAGQGTPTIEFEAGGSSDVWITVRVFNPSGCGRGVFVGVPAIESSPAPVISGPPRICPQESAILDAGPGYSSYLWSPGGATSSSINVTPSQTTDYTVLVIDPLSCQYRDTHLLTVDDPAPTFSGLTSAIENPSGCGVRLEWPAATPACADMPPLVYNVYRDVGTSVTPGPATLLAPCVTTTFYDDIDVLPGTMYAYAVRAENSATGGGGSCHNGGEETNTTQQSLTLSAGCAGLPGAVASFTARSKAGEVLLEWVNPGSSYGLTRVVQNDTNPPVDPTDGSTHDDIGASGETGGHLWTPLPNGVTQNLAAFVNSSPTASGLWSPGFQLTARPSDVPPGIAWVFSSGASALAPPGILPGSSIFAVSNDRRMHCMTAGPDGGMWPPGWRPAVMNGPADARPATVSLPTTTIGGASLVTFLSSQDGHVYAIDSLTGAELWRSDKLGDAVTAAPSGLMTDFGHNFDLILVGSRTASGDSAFYGLDLETGATEWSFDNGGGADGIGIISGQAQIDTTTDRVYFASRQKRDGSSNSLWCLQLIGPPNHNQLLWARDLGDIDGSPILRGGVLYVGNNAGQVFAIDPMDGTDASLPYTPAAFDGPVKGFVWVDTTTTPTRLYYSTTSAVHALVDDGVSISKLWPAASIASPSPLIIVGDGIWFGSTADNGSLQRIDKNTGIAAVPILLGDDGVSKAVGAPTYDIQPSVITVGTDEGRIYAVEIPSP